MHVFLKIMKALSDANRVRILKLLADGELCVCELQAVLGLAQSTVSKHMKILEGAGLVAGRRRGAWMLYRQAGPGDEGWSVHAAAMLALLRTWLEDDGELARMREALAQKGRIAARPSPAAGRSRREGEARAQEVSP